MVNGNPVSVPFACGSSGGALPAGSDGSQSGGAPCNVIPQSLINPIGQKLINLYPLPNANNAALGYNFVSEPVRKLNEGKFDIRLDENISTKDNLFARFSYDQATSYVPGGAPGFAEQGPFASNQSIINHARNVAASETHIFSPTIVNQITAGFQPHFRLHHFAGNGQLPGAGIRHPRRRSRRRQLRFNIRRDGRRILVVGRSWLYAIRGRDQCLDALRFVGDRARQPRPSNGRLHSSK